MKVIKTEVAIMGSGVAGLGAAWKLANAGVKVHVFEKYPAQGGAVSNCPMCFCSTPDTPEAQKAAFEVLARFSNYTANMGLVSKVVKASSELPELVLNQCKVEAMMKVPRDPADYGNQRGYTMGHANGLDVGDIYFLKGRGQGHAFALVNLRLRFMLEKMGVEFHFSTPITGIIRGEDGVVTGACAREQDGTEIRIECKALLVASGGITGNIPMMKEEGVINTPKYEEYYKDGYLVNITFPDSCQDGDGQKAVWEVGGKKGGICISADPQVPGPWVRPGPNTPWLAANQTKVVTDAPYLRVNELGKRFINEEMASNHTAMSSAACRNNPNMAYYLIFDEDTARKLEVGVEDGYVYFIFQGAKVEHLREQMDEAIAKGNKHMCHFDTIHEVCEYMDIDEAGLKKTIAKYNHAAEIGYDEEFHTNPKYVRPVREESGHIYCYRILPGGYDTLGGILVDENTNVLDTDGMPIEGLYSAGDMAAGSIYGDAPANAGGTVYGSMAFGFVAGESIAAFVKGEN